MAKNKFESNEEVIVEVVLTEEQHLLIAALESDDVIDNLSILKDDEGTTEKLATLITVYIALQNALGDDAGATINAHQNLVNYKPAKVKAAKKPKEPKAPKFNERKALAEALETDSLSTLIDDERISEELKNAIITYTTLRNLDLPEAIIDAAKITLAKFGRKGTTKTQNTEAYSVEVNGVVYSTRSKAVRAQGFGAELVMVGDKERKAEDLVWRSISSQFNKNDTAVYDNVTYTKVAKVEDMAA
jgi:uncharacterized protein YutE (UPF0331/DUF86 family)